MEEPHKRGPIHRPRLELVCASMLLTRCTTCDLEENQSATGGRILGFKVKLEEVKMQAADIMPRIEADKLRTATASLC